VKCGRKISALCSWSVFSFALYVAANSESGVPAGGKKGNRYDGVQVDVIPKPHTSRPPRKARAVWTTIGPEVRWKAEEGFSVRDYDWYARTADTPYVSRRDSRLSEAAMRQIARQAKHFARRTVRKIFKAGPSMDADEYRRYMEEIDKIGGIEDPQWGFQYDKTDPVISDRFEREWDDTELVVWGPVTVTDSGALDLDVDFDDLKRLGKVDLEDIVVAPPPPDKRPPRLIGQTVRFRTRVKLRISSSRIFKTFYQRKPSRWLDQFLSAARYLKLSFGADMYTDILKRRYVGTSLEVRVYRTGDWATFFNVALYGR